MNWSLNIFYIKFVPWRLFIIVNASVNALIAVAFLFLPETPKFLLTINEPDESLKVLRQMYETNMGKSKEVIQEFSNKQFLIWNRSFFYEVRTFVVKPYPVEHIIPEASGNSLVATKGFANVLRLVWDQTKPIFVPPYLDSTVKLCFMVFTLFAIGHGLSLWWVTSVLFNNYFCCKIFFQYSWQKSGFQIFWISCRTIWIQVALYAMLSVTNESFSQGKIKENVWHNLNDFFLQWRRV